MSSRLLSRVRTRRRPATRPETAIELLEGRMLLSAAPSDAGPKASDLSFHYEPGAVVTEIFLGYDAEGRWADVEIVGAPSVGRLDLHPHLGSRGFVYHPPEGFDGTVTFTYRVRDGAVLSELATVTIVFDAPAVLVAEPLLLEGRSGSPLVGRLSGHFADGRAADAFHEIVAPPPVGTLVLNEVTGEFIYNSPAGFAGTVTFRHVVWVGTFSQPATVTIVIDLPAQDLASPPGAGHLTGSHSVASRAGDVPGSPFDRNDEDVRISPDGGDASARKSSAVNLPAAARGAELLGRIANACGRSSSEASADRKLEVRQDRSRRVADRSDEGPDDQAVFGLDWTELWDGHGLATLTGALCDE